MSNKVGMEINVRTHHNSGEMVVSLEFNGQMVLIARQDIENIIGTLQQAAEYIDANQQLANVPDNVVQLKH